MPQKHTILMKKARKIAVVTLLTLSVIFALSGLFLLFYAVGDAKLNANALPNAKSAYVLYDKDGFVIENEDFVRLEDISEHIRHAFIAVEDKRFYDHNGIDLKRTVGALLKDVKDGKFSQGGSTISNQLVKNTQLTSEKTVKRKLKEAKITLELEKTYDKNEILEMYLNVLYFGKGIYGVKNACETLYAKSPAEVSPLEAASLAATVANPSKYSILLDHDKNLDRSRMILGLMKEQGYLSASEYESQISGDIIIIYAKYHNNYSKIYANSAYNEAFNILSEKDTHSFRTPYRIYTYFDAMAQNAANNALSNFDEKFDKDASNQELLIADNASGAVVAYASNTERAFKLKRQPGSLLKPFIYAKAIESGLLLPDSPLLDEQIDLDGYHPANFGDTYYGWISAREALSRSVNSAAVRILSEIGLENGANAIKNAGIPLDKKDITLSLALGGTTYGSAVKEIAEGYLTLANAGIHKNITFISKITDASGRTVYTDNRVENRVFKPETAYLTTDMLLSCAKGGTAKQLSYLNYDVAAKTGTVSAKSGNSDAWCAAYTKEHTFICRFSAPKDPFGNDVTGGNLPAKAVRSAVRSIYATVTPEPFSPPAALRKTAVDKTIKDEFHKLVPYKNSGFGEKEYIYTTNNFRFDAADPELLLLKGLSVQTTDGVPKVSFNAFPGIEYEVLINGTPCQKSNDGYFAQKQRFPIGKLDIYCKKDARTIWKTTRLVRLY